MPQYNPDLVTFITPRNSEGEIAIITANNLDNFRKGTGMGPGAGFITPLLQGIRQAHQPSRNFSPNDPQRGRTSGYVTTPPEPYHYTDGRVYGILASEALRLLSDLQDGQLAIRQVGQKAIELFSMFCDELYIEGIVAE